MKLLPGSLLIHKKNRFYMYLGKVRSSEDCNEEFVIYRALYEDDFPYGQEWVRPIELFTEERFRPLTFLETLLYWFGVSNKIKF